MSLEKAYHLIKEYYGTRRAARSQVLLIQHIEEGLQLLQALGANETTQAAYCLHPFLQSDEDFVAHKESLLLEPINAAVLLLTMEYRRVANSYLSTNKKEEFVGFSCPEVRLMLLADKVQNYKDFCQYHKGIHPKTALLEEYFHNWFDLLQIDYEEFLPLLIAPSQ